MKKLEFCQNTFDIDPHGILIWSKLNTAIVSDLHLEKGSSYAKYGQYIPPYDSLETLIKLEKILSNYVIKKIIFLGDTFHDKNSLNRMNIKTQKKLKSLTNLYEFILIEGNHDKNIMYEIPSHKILRINDIEFIHEAIIDNKHQISGHYHPTLSIKLNGKRVTEKCILQTESKLILPSFGKYTGGLSINNKIFKPYLKSDFNAYICNEKNVYKFSSSDLKKNVK